MPPIQILHVDDDPSLLDLTTEFLEREDDRLTIETVSSADEGLDRIADCPPDCIVSDYDMPSKNGIEFLETVRKTHPDLPFVLFTGKGSESVASEAMTAGVTDYLQKGSGTEQYELLANRITNAVKSRREAQRADRRKNMMRLTEIAGDTGSFELDTDSGEVIMTDGTHRILNLPEGVNPNFEKNLQHYHPDDRQNIRQTVQRAVQTGEQTRGTWRYQHPDTEDKLLDVTYMPVTANGETTTVRGAICDITDRRERQQKLQQLQQAIDNANVPITLADPSQEGNPLVYVNDGFEETTGYPPEEALGRNCWFLHGEDTDPEKVAALREAIANGESISVELRNYRKDGTEFWNQLTVTPIYDDDDSLVRYLGTQKNVTERKEREQELRTEQRLIEQSLNAITDLFYVINTDGTIRRWNDQVPDITGYTESELDGMHATEMFPEDEQERIADALERTLTEDRETAEADLQTSDGSRIPYEWTGAVLTDDNDKTTGFVGIGRDITERRQRERRFRALVEESSDIISIIDNDGSIRYQSPSIERILGYSPDETAGDTTREYIHPDDREPVREAFEGWMADTDAREPVEHRVRHADGSWRWLEARGSSQFDDPVVDGYVVNSRDITARKERERELNELTAQYQSLIENFPGGGLFLFDENLRSVHAGGKELAKVGLSSAELRGTRPHDIFPEEIADEHVDYFEKTLAGESHTYYQEYQGRHYEIRTMPVREESGEITYGMAVSRNISQQVEQKRELKRQNERLEEFTSVVSHDLRNPLQVAVGRLELAQQACDSTHLDDVADALDRSQALIDDLLTLARGGDTVGSREAVSVSAQAEECWEVIPGNDATLKIKSDQTVIADRSRLQQLLENLLANAIEHGSPDTTVSVGSLATGFYVADDGVGIPNEERDSVFEAGYSTTEDGTGFGLRIVKEIVDAHGWEIEVVESHSGGARFEITEVNVSG